MSPSRPLGLFPGQPAPLPDALVRKYPNADREWGWQWVFPASSHYLDRGTTHVLNRGGRGVASPLDRLRKPMGMERADLGRPAGRPNTGEVS